MINKITFIPTKKEVELMVDPPKPAKLCIPKWFKDLPELLVGLHLVGSTLVWIASWRVWLSVTKRMESK